MSFLLPVATQVMMFSKHRTSALLTVLCLNYFALPMAALYFSASLQTQGPSRSSRGTVTYLHVQVGLQLLLQPASSAVIANVGWQVSQLCQSTGLLCRSLCNCCIALPVSEYCFAVRWSVWHTRHMPPVRRLISPYLLRGLIGCATGLLLEA